VSIACEGLYLHGHIVPVSRAGVGTLKIESPGCRAHYRARSLAPLWMLTIFMIQDVLSDPRYDSSVGALTMSSSSVVRIAFLDHLLLVTFVVTLDRHPSCRVWSSQKEQGNEAEGSMA
jgi:hypothetical protein